MSRDTSHLSFDGMCVQHKDQPLEYFCWKHESVECSTCANFHFRTCKEVDYIKEICEDVDEQEEFQTLNRALSDIRTTAEKNTAKSTSTMENIHREVTETKECIRTYRKYLDRQLDRMEEDMYKEVDNASKIKTDALQAVSVDNEVLLRHVGKLFDKLDSMRVSQQKMQLFITMKQAKCCISELKNQLDEIESKSKMKQFQFKPDDSLSSMIAGRQTLGKIVPKDDAMQTTDSNAPRKSKDTVDEPDRHYKVQLQNQDLVKESTLHNQVNRDTLDDNENRDRERKGIVPRQTVGNIFPKDDARQAADLDVPRKFDDTVDEPNGHDKVLLQNQDLVKANTFKNQTNGDTSSDTESLDRDQKGMINDPRKGDNANNDSEIVEESPSDDLVNTAPGEFDELEGMTILGVEYTESPEEVGPMNSILLNDFEEEDNTLDENLDAEEEPIATDPSKMHGNLAVTGDNNMNTAVENESTEPQSNGMEVELGPWANDDAQPGDHDASHMKQNGDTAYDQTNSKNAAEQSYLSPLQGGAFPNAPENIEQSDDRVNIKVKSSHENSKRFNSFVSGCVITQSKYLVVADHVDESIKTVDLDNRELKHRLELEDPPWSMTKVSENSVAITCPRGQYIQMVTVRGSEMLSFDRRIQVEGYCHGINYKDVKGGMFVVSFIYPNKVKFIDKSGTVLKEVAQGAEEIPRFGWLFHVALSDDGNTIITTDDKTEMVTGLTPEGTVKFEYKDDSLMRPRGITFGDDGEIYVVGMKSNNIHVISSEGQKIKVLVGEDNGIICPECIFYSDCKVFVGCHDNDFVVIYNIQEH